MHTNAKTRMLIKKFVRLKYLFVVLGCLGAISMWPVRGQVLPAASPALAPTPTATPTPGLQALPQTPDLVPTPTPTPPVDVTPTPPVDVTPTPTPFVRNPTGEPGDPKRNTESAFWLDSYPLNDLSQYLAHEAGFQFFQNPQIRDYTVTGELFKQGNAMEALHALALQYNLIYYQKGRTIFLLTQDQFHSPSFFTTHRYRLKHQIAEYLLEPIANFLGIVAKPAGQTFPGYPIPNNVPRSAPAAARVEAGAMRVQAGLRPRRPAIRVHPARYRGVPFDAPLSMGGFSEGRAISECGICRTQQQFSRSSDPAGSNYDRQRDLSLG